MYDGQAIDLGGEDDLPAKTRISTERDLVPLAVNLRCMLNKSEQNLGTVNNVENRCGAKYEVMTNCRSNLLEFVGARRYSTILADPPWQFVNRTGKIAPEHKRLSRYPTMTLGEILALPIPQIITSTAHLYLWCPNALLPEGLAVMKAWGFNYKSNLVWHKIRKDGGSDGRGVGFYFRNVTELILFGVRGKNARTLAPARSQVNLLASRKQEHSRKPDKQYDIIEACSPSPYLELFARGMRPGWTVWGNQANKKYRPTWPTYVTSLPLQEDRPQQNGVGRSKTAA